jgi:hypothetical protein
MKRQEIPQILFKNINLVEPYPPMVTAIPKPLTDTAFFPGGDGLWKESTSDKVPFIMVLGQDFSTEKIFGKMQDGLTNDLKLPTWKNMLNLFAEAGISPEDCFFSNVFMGLRQTESIVGPFPGLMDKEFVARSLKFLEFQLSSLKPKIIITLGNSPTKLLSQLSNELGSWQENKAFKNENEGFKKDVKFPQHTSHCVAIEHPSMRNSNVKRRKYIHYSGHAAEVEMLKAAINF